jgi:hypothetical protein
MSDVLNPHQFIPEAFEESDRNDCVIRQVSAALRLLLFDVKAVFTEHVPLWQETGVTSSQLIEICTHVFRRPSYVVAGHRLIHSHRSATDVHRRGLAWAIVGRQSHHGVS